MVVSMAPAAFAGSFSDVSSSSNCAGAIDRLAGLGVVKGYPDGTFKPSNIYTRAEAAAINVRLLGLDSAAAAATGATKFSDVAADHWASGYINVASDQGIIQGMGDGTFRPDDQVTQAQALAMAIRILGYDPVVTGSWPTNYMVKAAQLKLTNGISNVMANLPASRCEVATMADNALTVDLMVQTVFGSNPQWAVNADGDNLLNTKLADDIIGDEEDVAANNGDVTNTPRLADGALAANQIQIDGITYDVVGLNPNDLAGLNVDAYLNDDGDIIAVTVDTKASNIVTGTVDEVDGSGVMTLVGSTKEYEEDSADVRLNLTDTDNFDNSLNGAKVKMVLNADGKVVFVEAFKDDDSLVVTEIDLDEDLVSTFDDNVGAAGATDFTDQNIMADMDGTLVGLKDLKVGDAIRVWALAGAELNYYIQVARASASGKLTAVDEDSDGNTILTVGGKEYTVGANPSLSTDNDDSSAALVATDLGSVLNANVTLRLDTQGLVRHVIADVDVPANEFTAIVSVAPAAEGTFDVKYKVSVYKMDGKAYTYEFVDKDAFTGLPAGIVIGDVVTVELNSDGKVKTLTEQTGAAAQGDVTDADKDNNRITIDGTAYRVTSSTVFIDAEFDAVPNPDTVHPTVVNASDVLDAFEGGEPDRDVIFSAEDGIVKEVIFDTNSAASAEDVAFTSATNTGVVVGFGVNADGERTVRINVKGTVTTYDDPTPVVYAVYAAKSVVNFTLSGSDVETAVGPVVTYDDKEVVQVDTTNKQIKIDVDGNLATTADQVWVLATSDTVLYDTDGTPKSIGLSDVKKGYTVDYCATEDVLVVVDH